MAVPQQGAEYNLPIPTAPIFGGQTFAVSLGESGEITSLSYGKTSGLGSALGATNDVLGAFKPETTAAKASEVQAEADLIAQQQRLIRCRLSPSQCATK